MFLPTRASGVSSKCRSAHHIPPTDSQQRHRERPAQCGPSTALGNHAIVLMSCQSRGSACRQTCASRTAASTCRVLVRNRVARRACPSTVAGCDRGGIRAPSRRGSGQRRPKSVTPNWSVLARTMMVVAAEGNRTKVAMYPSIDPPWLSIRSPRCRRIEIPHASWAVRPLARTGRSASISGTSWDLGNQASQAARSATLVRSPPSPQQLNLMSTRRVPLIHPGTASPPRVSTKRLSLIPAGLNSTRRAKSPSVTPVTRSTTAASSTYPWLLYRCTTPGRHSGDVAATMATRSHVVNSHSTPTQTPGPPDCCPPTRRCGKQDDSKSPSPKRRTVPATNVEPNPQASTRRRSRGCR